MPELTAAVERRCASLHRADLALVRRWLDTVFDGAADRERHELVALRLRGASIDYFAGLRPEPACH